ncbi:MAG: alpha/beta hydrolase [Phycisphaerae bacterium]|nr:alpha/beta hydrolase [Phycisphaerae bacterium]
MPAGEKHGCNEQGHIDVVKYPEMYYYKASEFSEESIIPIESRVGEKNKPAPTVLICPGGGYALLAYRHEGKDLAKWFNMHGVNAAVLIYSVPNMRIDALHDAQRAIQLLRYNAARLNVDPKYVGIMGFSAGGHLAAHVSTDFKQIDTPNDAASKLSCRPDFSMLIYPAYIYEEEERKKLSPEIVITADTPPAFIAQSSDDRDLVDSSFNYGRALFDAKIPVEMHIFASGGHGYGMAQRPGNGADAWPPLAMRWLKRQIVDKKQSQ